MSFLKKNGGIFDVIRCDEPSYLIWKWHPKGVELGKGKREYAIRTNSTLRVKDGEMAVFVYNQKNGPMQDYIIGPYDQKIKTGNFPVLSSIIGMFYEGDTPFQAEVYFINLAEIIQINFAVPYFNVNDPRFPDFMVPVAVRGTMTFKIEDYEKFIKCHRLINFELDTFKEEVKSAISRYVKDVVTNIPASHNIPVVQIESKVAMINDVIELNVKERLIEDFGVTVTGLDISAIEVDNTSNEYIELKRITKDITMMSVETKAKADLEHYQESLRIQREEGQYATHLGTQSANINAYQAGLQAEVGIAGAQALGQMGANNVGNVDVGGVGFNPVSMMAGMAVGGAVGQNVVGMMNNAMNPTNIPPVPTLVFYLAVSGKATGPYDIETLKKMKLAGQFNESSLIWKEGMLEWKKASDVTEVASVFSSGMPEIPSE